MQWHGTIVCLLAVTAASGCLQGDEGDGTDGGNGESDGTDGGDGPTAVHLQEFLTGFERPLLLTHAGDGSGRVFVVEQPGRIQVLPFGAAAPDLYLDITDRVGSGGNEQGLLGLAFHPEDPTVAIVSYTDGAGDSVLSRFMETGGVLDPDSEEVLLQVAQPFTNHNGGHILFGPDGMLYYGLGDGGLAGDPNQNGQNRNTLLGSLLRIGVGTTGDYTIPDDNPFVGEPLARGEVWAYGLRNPWRFSIDAETGALWIGDVGQDGFEEVDREVLRDGGGKNYGWNHFEGDHQFPSGAAVGSAPGYTFPVIEYAQDPGGHCSVTGGHVYRGAAIPSMAGRYVYADFCSGTIWHTDAAAEEDPEVLLETDLFVSSFGTDEAGELYVLGHNGGKVYRVARDTAQVQPSPV